MSNYQNHSNCYPLPSVPLSLASNALWASVAFMGAQRFLLPDIALYMCLVPFIAALSMYHRDPAYRNTLLLVAVFLSSDKAVLGFDATPSLIRYIIYLTTFLAFFQRSVVLFPQLTAMVFVLSGYMAITIINVQHLSLTQMSRDLQISALLIALLCTRQKEGFSLNLNLLFLFLTSFLISENINFFFLKSFWHGAYMSFDTTKYLVVFPSIYALLNKRIYSSLALISLTLPVLVGYTTRTLILSYLLALLYIVIFESLKHGAHKRIALTIIGLTIATVLATADFTQLFESFKALNMALIIKLHGAAAIQALDPVRFAEAQIFFQMSPTEILFGRGFGSGIEDTSNALGFVTLDQNAFSREELDSGQFYAFHDVWVDVGLRFGLLPFISFLIWLYSHKARLDREGVAVWLLSLVGIASAFYSLAGLLTIFILMRVIMYRRPACSELGHVFRV